MKFAALVLFLLAVLAPAAPAAPPNFVIILADDMGYGDPGYHGGKAKTPNIDRLAAEGVKLEAHYVHPMCSPTRMVRRGPWKLVDNSPKDPGKKAAADALELFNLEEDISETKNHISDQPALAAELGKLLDDFAAQDNTAVVGSGKAKKKKD